MRHVLGFIIFFNTVLAIMIAAVIFYGYGAWSGPGPLTASHDTVIARGMGVSTIADHLEREGVISNALVFKIAARLSGRQAHLRAGEYRFPAGMPARDVLDMLARGVVIDRKITIPEGRTSWQVVQLVNAAEAMSGNVDVIPPEGSLLPETYHYTRDMDRAALIVQMQADMRRALDELWPSRTPDLPLSSPEEAITLAAIVEKETGIAAERPRIAGVFINRLRRGMPLQTDPTVIYALTGGVVKEDGVGPLGRRLLRKDILETDSPYNTYKYPGLPPGPIANPGRAAIAATLNPERHDYLYFVADGSGGHVFAKTLDEHTRNVAAWRKIRQEQEAQ